MAKIKIDTDRCKGCELCTEVCPKDVLKMSQSYNANDYCYPEVSRVNKCIGCLFCVKVCPDICFEIGDEDERLI